MFGRDSAGSLRRQNDAIFNNTVFFFRAGTVNVLGTNPARISVVGRRLVSLKLVPDFDPTTNQSKKKKKKKKI